VTRQFGTARKVKTKKKTATKGENNILLKRKEIYRLLVSLTHQSMAYSTACKGLDTDA